MKAGAGVVGWVRYGIVLLGGFLAGTRTVGAFEAWRQWRTVVVTDPSAAELYQTTAILDVGVAVLSVTIAFVVWWLLRPPSGPGLP